MPLQILGDDSGATIQAVESAIHEAIQCEVLDVSCGSPGHYTIRVISNAFAGLNRVKQQQLVYSAIAPLMSGDAAPVHAVDRLDCSVPG